MNYEILNEFGEVINKIVADLAFVETNYPGHYRELPDPPVPYPVPIVPQTVSPLQAKAALLNAGLLDDIEALIANPETDKLTILAWNNAQEYKRSSPMIENIITQLGLTEEDLDNLFIEAAKINL